VVLSDIGKYTAPPSMARAFSVLKNNFIAPEIIRQALAITVHIMKILVIF